MQTPKQISPRSLPKEYLIYAIPIGLLIVTLANHLYIHRAWLISSPYIFSVTILPTLAIQLKRRYTIEINRMVLHSMIAWLLCNIIYAISCFLP